VVTHRSGWTFAASWAGAGGISAISPDGDVFHHLVKGQNASIRPNGVALEPEGTFLIAHLGAEDGGVHRLHHDGSLEPVLTEVSGRPIPPSNFPVADGLGRLWLSVSTTRVPRALDYNPDAATGLIILKDHRGARVVADGLGYANEFIVTDDGRTIYLNETFRRRLVRYDVQPDGALKGPSVVATFGPGDFPDGLAMDSEGAFWVTSIVTNRLIRIDADGRCDVVVEDCDPEHAAWVEEAFQAGAMGRPHLDTTKSKALRNISSLAFGGPDLRTGYLGCLLGDSIATIRMPAAGQPLPHHSYKIDTLIEGLRHAKRE
jgi:hypothetical protein